MANLYQQVFNVCLFYIFNSPFRTRKCVVRAVSDQWFLSLARTGLNSAFGSGPACSQQFPLRDCAAQHYHNEKLLI